MSSGQVIRGLRHRGIRGSFSAFKKALREQSGTSLPLAKRLRAWRYGFKDSSYILYDLDHNDPRNYLPDIVRVKTIKINSPFTRELLTNKVLFSSVMRSFLPVPESLAVIEQGRLYPLAQPLQNLGDLLAYCRAGGVVLKPISGAEGKGVLGLKAGADGLRLNGEALGDEEIKRRVLELHGYLLTPLVRQADYAHKVFPEATNTLRIITMRDPDLGGKPFIAMAVHRFGTKGTGQADNWAKGGLIAPIELETGVLGKGLRPPSYSGGRLIWHETHPDTGAQVEGLAVPNWTPIKKKLLATVDTLGFLTYVGWDVVVTDKGFCVIEGNNHTSIDFQIFHPLLKDARTRRFYAYYGII